MPQSIEEPITQDKVLNVLEANQQVRNALSGITGSEVATSTTDSCYILLSFASQKCIDQLREQNKLPSFLDGVPVEVSIKKSSKSQ